MDDKNLEYASQIINPSYAVLGMNSLQTREKMFRQLLTQRQLPQIPFDQLTIKHILLQLAIMDSNNFPNKIGIGQRQSRIFSNIVSQRNFYMGHGIGRSGDIMANQPKAAGSSLLLQLTKYLTVSALKQLNYQFVKDLLLLPMATGMSLSLSFLTLSQQKPQKKYVIWSRIDQKTCLKSIITANLIPVVIQEKIEGDCVVCDHQKIQQKIKQIGEQKILCIVSTTSCFAPRVPDDVSINSQIAKKYGIYHVVNNAYGLWCTKISAKIRQGFQNGQCTVVVQSTDKNFMVPVGGSIVFCQKPQTLTKISSKYPGRASAAPIVDLFITLLSMGKQNIKRLKNQHKSYFKYFKQQADKFANTHNFKVLQTKNNSISIAMQLKVINITDITQLGAILYSKRVMGHRIVKQSQNKSKVGGIQFSNYGSHHQQYPYLPYITFACAVGIQKQEIDQFLKRLLEGIKQLKKKNAKRQKKQQKQKQQKIQQKQQHKIQQKQQHKKQQKQQQQSQQEKNKLIKQKQQIKLMLEQETSNFKNYKQQKEQAQKKQLKKIQQLQSIKQAMQKQHIIVEQKQQPSK